MMGYEPETCRDKETLINHIVVPSWHFTSFHDEDAWSNKPQIGIYGLSINQRG